jgi:hypothetical protein
LRLGLLGFAICASPPGALRPGSASVADDFAIELLGDTSGLESLPAMLHLPRATWLAPRSVLSAPARRACFYFRFRFFARRPASMI